MRDVKMPNTARYRLIPDWGKLRKRYLAYWESRLLDDMIIAHIQNPNPDRPDFEDWMLEESQEKYLNPEKLFKLLSWRRTAWNWHADLFKYILPSYGPNVFIGFCGAPPAFGRDTVWHEPAIKDLDEADKIHFDEDNRYWKVHLETVEYFSEKCNGELHLGMSDLGGPADWISAVMGTESFLIQTIEHPERMRQFALRLAAECNGVYDILNPMITRNNDGVVNWMPVWSDIEMGTVQDDMAINFSPRMYVDVFMPAIREMAQHTERTVLHWHDGCAHHLDNLLKIDAIDVVQYGHDPNSPPFRENTTDMQKIQAAGKNLFISCVEAADAEFFLEHLDPRGLLMIIDTENDEESARMEENVRAWTKRRMQSLEISKGAGKT